MEEILNKFKKIIIEKRYEDIIKELSLEERLKLLISASNNEISLKDIGFNDNIDLGKYVFTEQEILHILKLNDLSLFLKFRLVQYISDDEKIKFIDEVSDLDLSPYMFVSLLFDLESTDLMISKSLELVKKGKINYLDFKQVVYGIGDKSIIDFAIKQVSAKNIDTDSLIGLISVISSDKLKADFTLEMIKQQRLSDSDLETIVLFFKDKNIIIDFLLRIKDLEIRVNCLDNLIANRLLQEFELNNVVALIFENDDQIINFIFQIFGKYNHGTYSSCKVGTFIKDDNKKINTVLRILESGCKIDINLNLIIESIENDNLKANFIMQLVNKYNIDSSYMSLAISSIKNDDLKIKLVSNLLELGKFQNEYLSKIISSINDDSKRISFIKQMFQENRLNDINWIHVVDSLKDESILSLILALSEYENSYQIVFNIIKTIDKNELKYKALEIISNKYNQFSITEKCKECGFLKNFETIDEYKCNELSGRVNEIIELYNGKVHPSISNLKSLIGIQAINNFDIERNGIDQHRYIPGNAAEIIVSRLEEVGYENIINHMDFILDVIGTEFKESEIINLYNSFLEKEKRFNNNDKVIISDIEKNKNMLEIDTLSFEDYLLLTVLNKLNIRYSLIGGEYKNDLLKNYFLSLKNIISSYNMSIKELLTKSNINKFKEIFNSATRAVLSNSLIIEENTKDGGLLTQLCTYVLNIQQRNGEEKHKIELQEKIRQNLLLTEKGKDEIIRRRVDDLIKEIMGNDFFERKDKDFSSKMNDVFAKLAYDYSGEKNTKVLEELMSKDIRFKEHLSQKITSQEKDKLPFDRKYFMLDEKVQMLKMIVSILNSLNIDAVKDISLDTLNGRMDVIKSNLKEIISDTKSSGYELLRFDDLELLSENNLSSLLLFYKLIRDSKSNGKSLNPENFTFYINKTRAQSFVNSKYSSTLGQECINMLEEPGVIIANYDHYINNVSNRLYRTIPNINGEFISGEEKLKYRSYDVDDPEQLIAGVRIPAEIKSSCFRIGGFQNDTIKYITSSPNGIIIAVENEKGEFMGRVYGYRVGNTVHFTRVYYTKPYDFKEAIECIGKSIIDSSNEIDYVTCIDETCTGKRYINKNIVYCNSNTITKTQEGNQLETDHKIISGTSIVAMRKNLDNINDAKFEREPNTERFYKNRNFKISVIDINSPNGIQNEEYQNNMNHAINIIYRSGNSNYINNLKSIDNIIVGYDWVILYKKGEIIMPISINYGNTDEAYQYQKIVQSEIDNAINYLVNNKMIDYNETIKSDRKVK